MKTEYIIQNNKAVIYNGKRVYTDFEPYFYIKEDDIVKECPEIVKTVHIDRTNLHGDKLKKVVTRLPSDVGRIRDRFKWHGEADVRFTKRFIVDNDIKQVNKHKIYIDIEVVIPKGGNVSRIGMYPISMICIYNELNNIYHQWVQHESLFVKTITMKWENRLTKQTSKRVIHQSNSEKLMLLDFIGYLSYHKPDMVIEWSVGGMFDITYIIERAKQQSIDYRLLSPIRRVKSDKYIDISGIEAVSMYQYDRKYHIGERNSNKLDSVCKDEFGMGKLYIVDDYEKEYNENLSGLLNYNLVDVELMVNLDKHTKLFENIQYIIDGIGCEMNDYLSSSMIVRMYLLKKAIEHKVVLDTWQYDSIISFIGNGDELHSYTNIEIIEYREEFNRGLLRLGKKLSKYEEGKFINGVNRKMSNSVLFTIEGAHVVEPKKGVFENVELYDYKSMYPEIIIKYNMSPETLVKYDDRNKHKPEDLYNIGNGVYFLREHIKKGFLPMVLEELFTLRYDVKNQMKNVNKNSRAYDILDGQQTGIKYIINSFYGVMKHICIWIAESTTFIGRKMIKWTINIAEELGCLVVYGDTDSIYIVKTNYQSQKKLETILMEEFKKEWGMSIELEHEGDFTKALFLTKKRYVTMDKNGEYKYKGLEIVRSDASVFHKQIQKTSIDMLFNGKNQDEVMRYIRTEIKDIPNKNPTLLAKRTKLNFRRKTKTGITKFEIAARVANKTLYKEYKTGDKPYYLPGICFDYDDEVNITENMIPKLIEETTMKVSKLFDTFGWDMDELMSDYKQERFEI